MSATSSFCPVSTATRPAKQQVQKEVLLFMQWNNKAVSLFISLHWEMCSTLIRMLILFATFSRDSLFSGVSMQQVGGNQS